MTDEDLRAKYEISGDCPLTTAHVTTHIRGALKSIVDQDNGRTVHELCTALQIMRAVTDKES